MATRTAAGALPDVDFDANPSLSFYLSVALVAGAVIALQICVMRIFSVGSWAHFGSLVVSLAMFGFGLTSAVMCIGKGWFERHWRGTVKAALLLFGPMMVGSNLVAQQVPFNAIFLISDPAQKWRLFANFILYFLPFLCGAFYLGVVFLKAQKTFNRVYFADLAGSGACGLMFLLAMYVFVPENLIVAPLLLWAAGAVLWFHAVFDRRGIVETLVVAALSIGAHYALPPALGISKLAVSDYKGVSYARKFPDNQRVYERATPFGYMEVYASSYLHFAPGLSDNAAFNLKEMPEKSYLGMYIDSEGPSGIIKQLPDSQTAYFRYLSMYYPYVLKKDPETFVTQFGGGLSTTVALRAGSRKVTVAEGNPMVLDAFRTDAGLRAFTGDILNDKRVEVIDYDGRLYLAYTKNRYDVIDLALADSAGLSAPGGFSIVEKFGYTREAMRGYMRALKPGGVLAVTLWNKEEPPKSVLKLYATMAAAARDIDGAKIADRFYVASSYLSTVTVLYKRDGFGAADIETLRKHTKEMSFDDIYHPGMPFEPKYTAETLKDYCNAIFFEGEQGDDPTGPKDPTAPKAAAPATPKAGPKGYCDFTSKFEIPGAPSTADDPDKPKVPAITISRIAWHYLVNGGWDKVAAEYVFDTRELTNHQPYFAAYVKVKDLLRVSERLEVVQDEWGYLLIWATLGIAAVAAVALVLFPVAFGWRTIFSRYPGKFGAMVYFLCLG
ncbi:MAG: hypothetical protein JNL07_00215, partial [Rhodospirillales bacterium]|nr:hypothetical protein [Rhodospirillales bacterium]